MKIILLNGSPRSNGKTAEMLALVEEGLKENGVENFKNLGRLIAKEDR